MTITFTATRPADDAVHHARAAAGNLAASNAAIGALTDALEGTAGYTKILLRAAAGAGKSFALVGMVKAALVHQGCSRVAVSAFANKQVFPLAGRLGTELGADAVCLFVADARRLEVPPQVEAAVTIATTTSQIPADVRVVLGVSHKLGAISELARLLDHLGPGHNETAPFDVLFVDEAWQLPLHRFHTIDRHAPLVVGVGDVGQLPPLDPGQNPWRGDSGYNPYRAWPTAFDGQETTFSVDLPAVWRPHAAQLPLWRAFYSDWDRLDCVAAPGDRTLTLPDLTDLTEPAAAIWGSVATGVPTLIEVAGLDDAEAPDVDLPLLGVVESLLAPLLDAGFAVHEREYDGNGDPKPSTATVESRTPDGDPLIVLLATRNQAVDDAQDLVDRLTDRYDLPDGVLVASTVDSWQGQTNRITVALHPLSGASSLDEFNSAFGRLAVTCTRATHGLLVLARAGLDQLLTDAPARPGTPFGEPGTRTLPRQTHRRILDAFARGMYQVQAPEESPTGTA